ncbi:hypothetical protein AAKU55_000545 [Oxalobacteraceae bacterium GrIS 1.11]
MIDYNNQYFFIGKSIDNPYLPSLTPDTNTENRKFGYKKQHLSSSPLIFYNGAKEFNKNRNVEILQVISEVLFCGADLVVSTRIREALLQFNIPNLDMHPAIYINDDDKRHEDYWYMTFTDNFDCWDRNNSTYKAKTADRADETDYSIYTYSLNQELLDNTPLEQRLLFKMGADSNPSIVCHNSLSNLFYTDEKSGTHLTIISEY